MHPLTSDLAEQILALVRIEAYSLLGAIQDGKTVLGGSAGSGGGTGDPPAGFVGQLTQSNVTFDTDGATRACSAGSAGSASLVGNLDAIRLGTEICNDAIGDRHIDWGIGAGQVSAVDVPFATTSGSIDATNVRDAIEETYAEGGGAGGAHTLLSGTHPDTDPAAVQRGDLLTGGSTLLWRRLTKGTAHQIPKMNSGGTDVDWASFDWDEMSAGSLADMVHDHGSAAEGGATLQLDWDTVWTDAVHDHSGAGEGGQSLLSLIDIRCNAATEETIDAFGNMNPDQIYVRVDTSLDVATDNLDTIVGGTEGDLLFIRPENDARTIVVRHNVGNIWLIGKTDVSLDDINDHIMLIFDGSKWCDTGVSVRDHGELAGLTDDDHAQYLLADGTRALTGALKSQGSGFPTLGTTTLAEKLGHSYLGTQKDVYPWDDEYPLFQRTVNQSVTPEQHFNTSTAPLNAWAGAPFIVPTSNLTSPSMFYIYPPVTNNRSFLYEVINVASGVALPHTQLRLFVGPFINFAGLRVDDGTDDNYFEWGILTFGVANGMCELISRVRAGAGAVTTTVRATLPAPAFYAFYLYDNGVNVSIQYNINGVTWKYLTSLGARGWTATRLGISIIQGLGGDGSRSAYCDWYYSS